MKRNNGPTVLTIKNNPIPKIGATTIKIKASLAFILIDKNKAIENINGALTSGLKPLQIAF